MWIQSVADGGVNAVTYSSDGSTLYTQDDGRWLTAWDVATHEGRRLFQYPELLGSESRQARVSNHFPRLFTSPDDRFLVSNTSPALVWDLDAGALHAEIEPQYSYAGTSAGVGRVRVECVSEGWLGIRTWYLATRAPGEELTDWPVVGTIKTHHFSPDGQTVALLSWKDSVFVCDVESRRLLHQIDMPTRALQHCRFAPDGRTLVIYLFDGICVWDIPSASVRVDSVACDRPYWMLAFHPTQPVVAARRRPDGLLCLLSLETGDELRAFDFDLGRQAACVAFSPDGLTCAVGGSDARFAVFDVDV